MHGVISLAIPLELIQSVRLAHALMEAGYRLRVHYSHANKFEALTRRFQIDIEINNDPAKPLESILMSHKEPRTGIGAIERPLIFPHAILTYCRKLWPVQRSVRYAFAGLITEDRKHVLAQWTKRHRQTEVPFEPCNLNAPAQTLAARIRRLLRMKDAPQATKHCIGDLVLWSSPRGRSFPVKSWDEEYYALLADSEFALCPSGDFVWSYRFFEAAMCGAIPVIEEYCEAYEGFRFRTLSEHLGSATWSQEDAEFNYKLCRDRITVPVEALRAEVIRLSKSA